MRSCISLLSRSKPLFLLKPPPLSIWEEALKPKPISTHLYSPISTNGSPPIRSFSVSIYRSIIRVHGKIRSSSICEKALNPKPTSPHLYSPISSNGLRLIRSFSVSIYDSRIRAHGKRGSFLVSSICKRDLNPKPTSLHLCNSIYSIGSHTIQSFSVSVYRSRMGARGKIRSFTVSSSEFESTFVNGVDENVTKDNPNLLSEIFEDDGSVLNDENATNDGSEVTNVDEDVEKADSKLVYEIVEAIRNCKEEKLDKEIVRKGEKISTRFVNETFRVLNSEKVSGLPLVAWAQDKNPGLFHRADFRSLIIDNCGWLGDYDAMLHLLVGFSAHGVCLTEKAFGFFGSLGGDKDFTKETIRKVVGILNEVGGSCRGTGLVGLIKMLCKLDLVEMALFVIQITEKKLSYYNVIVLEMCIRSRFDEARDLLEVMREANCNPDALSYTYILSALCKNGKTKEACDLFEEMEKKDCKPDALSFEIIILSMCRLGKMDIACKYFGQMVNKGLEPRITTNAALVKGYFNSEKYEEAYEFVVNLVVAHKSCGNSAYSLLVRLHFGKGDVVTAGKLLLEMMDKSFIPQFTLCKNISKQLRKMGQRQMANDIKARFSKLRNGVEMLSRTEKRE